MAVVFPWNSKVNRFDSSCTKYMVVLRKRGESFFGLKPIFKILH